MCIRDRVKLLLANEIQAIEVTLLGITTLVNWLPENAPVPMLVTPFGITTLVSWLSENAPLPILVTPSGMTTLSLFAPP